MLLTLTLLAAAQVTLGIEAAEKPGDVERALRSVPGVAEVESAEGAAHLRLDGPVSLEALRDAVTGAGGKVDEKRSSVRSAMTFHVDGRGSDACALLNANLQLLPAFRKLGGEAGLEDLDPRLSYRVRFVPDAPVTLKAACDVVRKTKSWTFTGDRAFRLVDVTLLPEAPKTPARWDSLLDLTDGVRWMTDPDAAMERAEKENRPLFLLVTGHC